MMNAAFIERWSLSYSRESVYTHPEIKWLMNILHKKCKDKDKTIKDTQTLLIICANGNVGNLYQLYNMFCENGIIIPLDVRRQTFYPYKKQNQGENPERSVAPDQQ